MDTLAELIDPAHTSIICMEMERGVGGDLSMWPPLRDVVMESGLINRCSTLFRAARDRGIHVVHCTAAFRPDRAGSPRNMPHLRPFLADPSYLAVGTPVVEVIPELWDPRDMESQRLHGISPFHGTSVDPWLRSFGTKTVIVTGVSLNRGIIGTSMEAVNHGYHVVVPRDCALGYPQEYGEMVLKHTLDGLCTLTTADELMTLWSSAT